MATRRSAVRRLQQAEPSAGTTYDAFISYSRDSDAVLAVALARGLTRLTRPWYRTRALRVFRDDASLAASPALWPSIEAALRDARFLVLLASSASARSPWVAREVEWWIAQRGLQRLLIVLTDAEPGAAGGGFEDMLPPVLRDALVDEPRFVDLRSARGRADLSLEDADFRAAVADLAAPMHGVPKEELIGEDVRQHRRTMRVVRGTAAVLGVLAIGAGAAAWLAVEQRNTARDQARRAIARSLALESAANLGRATDISLLLALEAYRMEPSFPARDALLTAIEHAAPRTAVFPRPRSGAIQRLDLSHDGRTALVSPYVGRPQLLDARRAETRELPWSVNHAQATNGRTVVSVHRSDRAQLWDLVRGPETGRSIRLEGISPGHLLVLSPDGRRLAAEALNGRIRFYDLGTSRSRSRPIAEVIEPDGDVSTSAAFNSAGTMLALVGESAQRRVSVWDFSARPPVRHRLEPPPRRYPIQQGDAGPALASRTETGCSRRSIPMGGFAAGRCAGGGGGVRARTSSSRHADRRRRCRWARTARSRPSRTTPTQSRSSAAWSGRECGALASARRRRRTPLPWPRMAVRWRPALRTA